VHELVKIRPQDNYPQFCFDIMAITFFAPSHAVGRRDLWEARDIGIPRASSA
jgi:hypothetical protein